MLILDTFLNKCCFKDKSMSMVIGSYRYKQYHNSPVLWNPVIHDSLVSKVPASRFTVCMTKFCADLNL